MQNCNGWLVLHDRDTVNIVIHIPSIQETIKHFVEERGRSYLCYGDDCTFCGDGIPKRSRYVARITFHGETLKWEFGAELYRAIKQLPAEKGLAKATVIRSGRGKKTRYQVRSTDKSQRSSSYNKYTSGRYGHLVRS